MDKTKTWETAWKNARRNLSKKKQLSKLKTNKTI